MKEKKLTGEIAAEEIPQPEHGAYEPHTKVEVRTRRDERSLAFHLIYAVDRYDYEVPLGDIVASFEKGFELEIAPNSFAMKLAHGTIVERDALDAAIVPILENWKIERLGVCTRLILRMAVWELLNTDLAHTVVINEAIELSKAFAEKDAYRFVNGILDKFWKKRQPEEAGK